jgi:hypothetical protein
MFKENISRSLLVCPCQVLYQTTTCFFLSLLVGEGQAKLLSFLFDFSKYKATRWRPNLIIVVKYFDFVYVLCKTLRC